MPVVCRTTGSGGAAFSEQANDMAAHFGQIDTKIFQNSGRNAFTFANQPEQQMLRADVVVTQLPGFIPGQFEHSFSSWCKRNFNSDKAGSATDDLLYFDARIFEIDSHRFECLGGDAGAFANQSQQDLLGAHKIVAQPCALLLAQA